MTALCHRCGESVALRPWDPAGSGHVCTDSNVAHHQLRLAAGRSARDARRESFWTGFFVGMAFAFVVAAIAHGLTS